MRDWFRRRYIDLLGSIYIYKEHRGYTSIDRILEAVRSRTPEDRDFIAAIEKHRADERKHYVMFKRWFELQGKMPLNIDRTCGHIDRFIEIMFGRRIDDLDTQTVISDDRLFEPLCRVIEKDEPSHWAPYDNWLKAHGRRNPRWWERWIDSLIHSELMIPKLPVLFINPWLRPRTDWADASGPAERLASPMSAAA